MLGGGQKMNFRFYTSTMPKIDSAFEQLVGSSAMGDAHGLLDNNNVHICRPPSPQGSAMPVSMRRPRSVRCSSGSPPSRMSSPIRETPGYSHGKVMTSVQVSLTLCHRFLYTLKPCWSLMRSPLCSLAHPKAYGSDAAAVESGAILRPAATVHHVSGQNDSAVASTGCGHSRADA